MSDEPFDTSRIEAMPREQLEHETVKLAQQLMQGIEFVRQMQNAIDWLAETSRLLGTELAVSHPQLKDCMDELLAKVNRISPAKEAATP